MAIGLAFRAFFAILFGKPLPSELLAAAAPPTASLPSGIEAAKAALREVDKPAEKPQPAEAPKVDTTALTEGAAVRVLFLLQSEGRLLDFLSEDIDGYADADVGAAVRDIHRGLKKALADHLPVEPLRTEEEDSSITVPVGFDPHLFRLTGNVVGEPPFSGTLKHKGWKVTKVNLPRIPQNEARFVVIPAEVEV
jgi:hypothetical protein